MYLDDRWRLVAGNRAFEVIGEALYADTRINSLAVFARSWAYTGAIVDLKRQVCDPEIIARTNPVRAKAVEELLDIPVRHDCRSIVSSDRRPTARHSDVLRAYWRVAPGTLPPPPAA